MKTLPPVVTTPPQWQLLQWIADPLRFLHTCTVRYEDWAHPAVGGLEIGLARMEEDTKKCAE